MLIILYLRDLYLIRINFYSVYGDTTDGLVDLLEGSLKVHS